MFRPAQQTPTMLGSAFALGELIYHNTVRSLRKTHSNAFVGLLMSMLQSVIMVIAFVVLFSVLGLRGTAIRGDFLLYIMSGIFLFMTHVKAMGAIVSSEGPASGMMKHLPMTTAVAIASAALGALYNQVLGMLVILYVYHVAFAPVVIDDPVGAFLMFLLAWISGVGVGLVFLAIKPWAPSVAQIGSQIYSRANMIASGKMFVANMLPPSMLMMFDWNPLFHAIDQTRGFVFVNYFPHNSSIMYPVYVTIGLIMVGLMGEFYTRKHASLSWGARR
ncbi:MAG: ABC transporter permease [Paracoccaceae bacterium]|nr:ABC transporter permease [Paracoccaceae bacterium]